MAWSPASFQDVQNDVHATLNNGDAVSYTFTGTGIAYVSEKSDGVKHSGLYMLLDSLVVTS